MTKYNSVVQHKCVVVDLTMTQFRQFQVWLQFPCNIGQTDIPLMYLCSARLVMLNRLPP